MLGTVPARPESRLPTPSAFHPLDDLEVTGTAVRCETRCIAMAWPLVSMAPMTVTMTNGTRRPKTSALVEGRS